MVRLLHCSYRGCASAAFALIEQLSGEVCSMSKVASVPQPRVTQKWTSAAVWRFRKQQPGRHIPMEQKQRVQVF